VYVRFHYKSALTATCLSTISHPRRHILFVRSTAFSGKSISRLNSLSLKLRSLYRSGIKV
jgi:hypothetical protein